MTTQIIRVLQYLALCLIHLLNSLMNNLYLFFMAELIIMDVCNILDQSKLVIVLQSFHISACLRLSAPIQDSWEGRPIIYLTEEVLFACVNLSWWDELDSLKYWSLIWFNVLTILCKYCCVDGLVVRLPAVIVVDDCSESLAVISRVRLVVAWSVMCYVFSLHLPCCLDNAIWSIRPALLRKNGRLTGESDKSSAADCVLP